MDTVVQGGCLCGAVRYRISSEPLAKTLCHCRTCRLASGGPSLAWVVFGSSGFTLTAGQPTGFQSSPDVTRGFCSTCGTSLTYQRTSRPDVIDVVTATLDHPEDFAPTKEIWVEQKLPWESLNPAMEHYARSSVGATPLPI